jgi:DNA-binding GntR family transcriptional regulator
LSLSGLAFNWFSSLEPNSITGWADLDNKFHACFYSGTGEKKITDLTSMRQRNNESGSKFIQRFREVRSRYYPLNLSDVQLAELALQGMSLLIREKFDG